VMSAVFPARLSSTDISFANAIFNYLHTSKKISVYIFNESSC
jgi:hypothetical protein